MKTFEKLDTSHKIVKRLFAMMHRYHGDLEKAEVTIDVLLCHNKDKDGEAHHVDMVGIQLSPTWAEGPAWPVVAPCKPYVVRPAPTKRTTSPKTWKCAVFLPDMQIGYFRDRDGNLHPTQDEGALDIALAIVRAAKPDVVILAGDNLDFPELSRFRLAPPFVQTTQATVDRAGLLLAQLRAAAGPECEIVWLAGNHEERLPNYILDNARAAFGLRAANQPDSWPLLSVPALLRTDDHAVTYRPGYPASEHWINDRLRVVHGHKVRSGGSTAHAYLNEERVSTLFGHVHRREWAERTRATRGGSRTILAASPGCLARTDGRVPSTKGGIDLDGLPVSITEDWQQGVAVVDFQDGDAPFSYEQVSIHDGWARWRGRDFYAAVDVEGQPVAA